MMIKQQSCFYYNILLYQPLCSTSLTETNDLWISEMKGRFIPSSKNWFNYAFRFKGCPNRPPLSKYAVKHRSLISDFS